MKRTSSILFISAYACGIISVLPFLLIAAFAWPSADDFSMAALVRELGRTAYVTEMYNGWTGRYAANILEALHPMTMGGLVVYRIIPVLILIMLFAAFRDLVRSLLKGKSSVRAAAAIVFLLYLNALPSPAESIYWYPGAVEYSLSLAALLFISATAIAIFRSRKISAVRWIVFFTALFLACGLNEISMFFSSAILMMLCVFLYRRDRRIGRQAWIPLFITITLSVIAVAAPGNYNRMESFPEAFDIPLSLGGALTSVIKTSGVYLQSPPFILISLLYYCLILSGRLHLKLWDEQKTPLLSLLVFAGALYLAFLPSWLATGLAPALRVHGLAGGIFITGWFYVSGKIASRYRGRIRISQAMIYLFLFAAFFTAISDFHRIPGKQTVCRGKIVAAWYDLTVYSANYNFRMKEREYSIRTAVSSEIPVFAVSGMKDAPATLHFCDMGHDYRFWINRAVARWYGAGAIQTVP